MFILRTNSSAYFIFFEAQPHIHLVAESHVGEMSTCEVTAPCFCSDNRLDVQW